MNQDFINAKEILKTGGYTCVLVKDLDVCTFTERGVKPLVGLLQAKKDYGGYFAADRVVGRATAFLYVLLGVKAVYANVISSCALEVLARHNIETEFAKAVDNIINRKGDDICPFEKAVLHFDDASKAYDAILNKMKELNITI